MKIELDTIVENQEISKDGTGDVAYVHLKDDNDVLLETKSIGFTSTEDLKVKVEKYLADSEKKVLSVDTKKNDIKIMFDSVNKVKI